ncbi:MAG: gluconate transporter [Bacteroidetes bacterium GWF2_42_66]|nr:MAG: gluconate transporter [Bacteroidetes bacterium GWA2_42_15]OFY01691.1 MAG: gluconate transporter [Bacteroidetes bacterium GWE2_42_39]OFY41021.1 MAG: gluconate transporter [Bacteroidetes bacterium GWF2_42_66]HBL76610.1 gluconate transporter [Prolixibacteraceae bacterium]HCR92004.1 gluconate transporter [Prolixibacteraceae bacterium]
MSTPFIIFLVVSAVFILLFLVLKLKINAFIALLITSIYVGILSGMPLSSINQSIQEGMAGTLGFVATVVGLGAIFGQMLESSGGAQSLAHNLVKKFGNEKASWALTLTGFLVAIPIFLDVGFIILVPIVYALARDTKKSILYYGIPLLAGLAVTHAFVPPTPGPVAVADIIKAELGWVILLGILIGIPVAILAGPVFGKYISKKIDLQPPSGMFETNEDIHHPDGKLPSFGLILSLIGIPLILILLSTVAGILTSKKIIETSLFTEIVAFCGHPFTALIIATLIAIYLLGIKRGMPKQQILDLSTKALGPAGIIILITGAGGVLKQILVDSGIGKMMAESIAGSSFSPILLAWLLAAIVRITQGSATVAMITAAGIIAPVLSMLNLSDPGRALIVIAIASGATILSHVNDSGFWLVSKYLGMNEKQTLQSWTVMETIISVSGLILSLIVSLFI